MAWAFEAQDKTVEARRLYVGLWFHNRFGLLFDQSCFKLTLSAKHSSSGVAESE
jgi:hypothetical protein